MIQLLVPAILIASGLGSLTVMRRYLRTGIAKRWWLAPRYARDLQPMSFWFEVAFAGISAAACFGVLGYILLGILAAWYRGEPIPPILIIQH